MNGQNQCELLELELDSDSDYLYRDELLDEAEQPDSNYPMNGQCRNYHDRDRDVFDVGERADSRRTTQ